MSEGAALDSSPSSSDDISSVKQNAFDVTLTTLYSYAPVMRTKVSVTANTPISTLVTAAAAAFDIAPMRVRLYHNGAMLPYNYQRAEAEALKTSLSSSSQSSDATSVNVPEKEKSSSSGSKTYTSLDRSEIFSEVTTPQKPSISAASDSLVKEAVSVGGVSPSSSTTQESIPSTSSTSSSSRSTLYPGPFQPLFPPPASIQLATFSPAPGATHFDVSVLAYPSSSSSSLSTSTSSSESGASTALPADAAESKDVLTKANASDKPTEREDTKSDEGDDGGKNETKLPTAATTEEAKGAVEDSTNSSSSLSASAPSNDDSSAAAGAAKNLPASPSSAEPTTTPSSSSSPSSSTPSTAAAAANAVGTAAGIIADVRDPKYIAPVSKTTLGDLGIMGPVTVLCHRGSNNRLAWASSPSPSFSLQSQATTVTLIAPKSSHSFVRSRKPLPTAGRFAVNITIESARTIFVGLVGPKCSSTQSLSQPHRGAWVVGNDSLIRANGLVRRSSFGGLTANLTLYVDADQGLFFLSRDNGAPEYIDQKIPMPVWVAVDINNPGDTVKLTGIKVFPPP